MYDIPCYYTAMLLFLPCCKQGTSIVQAMIFVFLTIQTNLQSHYYHYYYYYYYYYYYSDYQ